MWPARTSSNSLHELFLHVQVELLQTAFTSLADAVLEELGEQMVAVQLYAMLCWAH
jgi:hypothetical protein